MQNRNKTMKDISLIRSGLSEAEKVLLQLGDSL